MSKKIKFSKNNPEAKRDKSSQAPSWQKQEENLFSQSVNRRGFLNLSALFAASAAGSTLWTPNSQAGSTSTALSGNAVKNLPTPDLWYRNSDLNSYSNGNTITTWANSGSLGSSYNLVSGSQSLPTRNDQEGYPAAYFTGNRAFSFSTTTPLLVVPTSSYKQWTVIAVCKTYSNHYFGFLSGYPRNSSNRSSLGYYGNTTHYYVNYGDGAINTYTVPSASSAIQVGMRYGTSSSNNNTFTFWNGKSSSFNGSTYATSTSEVSFTGIGYIKSSYNYGWLYELQVYMSALTDDDINAIRADIGSRFTGTNIDS